MNKSLAINLLSRKGCKITNDITFASKNSTANTYWANPNESYIKKNWTLILNDTIKKTLPILEITEAESDLFNIKFVSYNTNTLI